MLGLSVHSLRSARSNKPALDAPPFVRVGGRVFYDREEVLAWARSRGIELAGPVQSCNLA